MATVAAVFLSIHGASVADGVLQRDIAILGTGGAVEIDTGRDEHSPSQVDA